MIRTAALALALALATQSRAEPLAFDGTLALGVTDLMGGRAIGFVDATLVVPLSRRVPLTFELGTYLFALDGKRPHETYAALAWDDRVRLGAVRPAYDAVIPSVFEEVAPYLAYSRAEYTRSHNTVEAMRRTAVPWGASFEDARGAFTYAASIHYAGGSGFHSASASFGWQGAGWEVLGALESVWSNDMDHDGINAKVGVRTHAGPVEIGLAYLGAEVNDRPDALAFDAALPVSSRITLRAFGELTDAGVEDAYGLSMTARMGQITRGTLAATDGVEGPALHAGVALDF